MLFVQNLMSLSTAAVEGAIAEASISSEPLIADVRTELTRIANAEDRASLSEAARMFRRCGFADPAVKAVLSGGAAVLAGVLAKLGKLGNKASGRAHPACQAAQAFERVHVFTNIR